MTPLSETSNFAAQLSQLEAELQTAAFRSVLEIPSLLTRLQTSLEDLRSRAAALPPEDRVALRARMKRFRSQLALFSLAMARSEQIFQGYSRRIGRPSHEYSPSGIASAPHSPAVINLSV